MSELKIFWKAKNNLKFTKIEGRMFSHWKLSNFFR